MKYPYCSCGGLRIDNDTIKVNELTGQLYVGAKIGEEVPVYKTLTDIGYVEPVGDFNPADFNTYCSKFPFGSKFIGVNLPDNIYPKLSAFITLAIGDNAFFDEVTTTLTIENHRDGNGAGAIKYFLTNGLPVTHPAVVQEYQYIANNNYDSKWERIYGDDNNVCFYTNSKMNDYAAIATPRDIGKTIINYETGNIFQLKSVTSGSTTTYQWEQMTTCLPTNSTVFMKGAETITINTSGHYAIFGNVGNLNITVTTPVQIRVFGIVAVLNLPNTTKTVILHADGYNGVDLTTTEANVLADGSQVGKFQIGCVAL